MKYSLLLLFLCTTLFAAETPQPEATLQATISVVTTGQRPENSIENFGKIQPGSKIKLSVTVKNIGTAPNAPGKLWVRFMFPEPLASQPNSLLFQTEEGAVPSITPGQEVVITLQMDQNWPSLFDFIRHDWGMRQFQAVMNIDGAEKILGTLSILFSAYYYEGPNKEISTVVPVAKPPEPKPDLRRSPAVMRSAQRPSGVRQFARQRAAARELVKK
jgi:hypothetical protein